LININSKPKDILEVASIRENSNQKNQILRKKTKEEIDTLYQIEEKYEDEE